MNINDAIILFLMFVVFGVTAIALAARLAIRPIVDAIVRLREHSATSVQPAPDPRVAVLEEEVRRLNVQVERLAEAEAFIRQLRAP